jgi:DNA-binding transcriptional ArsR family regulator
MDSVFDALSHPIRREILEILKGGSRSAGALADAFPVSKPTMSVHFARVKAAGLSDSEKRGASVIYSLNLSVLEEVLLGFMRRVGQNTQDGSGKDGEDS